MNDYTPQEIATVILDEIQRQIDHVQHAIATGGQVILNGESTDGRRFRNVCKPENVDLWTEFARNHGFEYIWFGDKDARDVSPKGQK